MKFLNNISFRYINELEKDNKVYLMSENSFDYEKISEYKYLRTFEITDKPSEYVSNGMPLFNHKFIISIKGKEYYVNAEENLGDALIFIYLKLKESNNWTKDIKIRICYKEHLMDDYFNKEKSYLVTQFIYDILDHANDDNYIVISGLVSKIINCKLDCAYELKLKDIASSEYKSRKDIKEYIDLQCFLEKQETERFHLKAKGVELKTQLIEKIYKTKNVDEKIYLYAHLCALTRREFIFTYDLYNLIMKDKIFNINLNIGYFNGVL